MTLALVSVHAANRFLVGRHYLGPQSQGFALMDDFGVLVFANPRSRRLSQDSWLELVRWCIDSATTNAGSRQWSAVSKWMRANMEQMTTIVSYSDPSRGHTGALYRACNWEWAPTWHRLRPPPTGHGAWSSDRHEGVKDRWAFKLRSDASRNAILGIKDKSVLARMPWASYQNDHGGDYKRFIRESQ